MHERVSIPQITITDPGYVYIYVANESEDTRVWWDDLKITHLRSNIVAGADYYPFGLPMENREITREDYRYGYQGQYAEKDKETGWNAFELRMYDADKGRWLTKDPLRQYYSPYKAMGNSPIMRVDRSGGWSLPPRVFIANFAETRVGMGIDGIGATFSGTAGVALQIRDGDLFVTLLGTGSVGYAPHGAAAMASLPIGTRSITPTSFAFYFAPNARSLTRHAINVGYVQGPLKGTAIGPSRGFEISGALSVENGTIADIYPGFTIVNPRALSVGGGALPFLDYSYTWASQEYRLNSVPNEELRRFGLTREHLNVAFENYNLQQARFQQYKSSVVSTTTSLIVGVGRDLLKRTAIEGLKRLPRFIPTRFFK